MYLYYTYSAENLTALQNCNYTLVPADSPVDYADPSRCCYEVNHPERTFKPSPVLGATPQAVFVPQPHLQPAAPILPEPEYPHLTLYKNTEANQKALFSQGYKWAAGNTLVQNLHVPGHLKANKTAMLFQIGTNVFKGHEVHERATPYPVVCETNPPTKSVLKVPGDYDFIARSLTVEQWSGYCLGNIINDKLNARETTSFFGDVFNKYKEFCRV